MCMVPVSLSKLVPVSLSRLVQRTSEVCWTALLEATTMVRRAAPRLLCLATAVGIGHPPVARAIDPSTTRLAVTSRVYLDLASEGESIGRLDVEVTREDGGRACCAHRSRPPLPPPPPNLPENTTTP